MSQKTLHIFLADALKIVCKDFWLTQYEQYFLLCVILGVYD